MKSPTCKSSCLLFLSALAIAAISLPVHAFQVRPPAVKAQMPTTDTQSLAYHNGYEDGWIAGEEAWANSGPFRMSSSDQYNKATHGYNENLGDKSEYKRLYKKGFEEGYSVGYGQSPTSHSRKDGARG